MKAEKEALLILEEIKWRCDIVESVFLLRDQFSNVANLCPKFDTQDFIMRDKDKLKDFLKENSTSMRSLITDINKLFPELIKSSNDEYQCTNAVGFHVDADDEYEEEDEDEEAARIIGFKVPPVAV